ncbi:uncharacterized protein LOC141655564 [Silene latifolia]|uniref:uncharacterized protein LOC141655564 n=1 Tax=Silene latifolia TaxID=37657 RepID=UPI003D778815
MIVGETEVEGDLVEGDDLFSDYIDETLNNINNQSCSQPMVGSDDESGSFVVFYPSVDFEKPICLKKGLLFPSVEILRKAVRQHAIENGYVPYFLLNDRKTVNIQCRYRCECNWNFKKSRMPKCACGEKKTLIAEKYLEVWRSDPGLSLIGTQSRVKLDYGMDVNYHKSWLARARAQLLIYGSSDEQETRVWDYVHNLKKYNPGSYAFVMVGRIERPPPVFQRMYISLKACIEGFVKGCRPLVGIDGCHIKGMYLGIILIVEAMDGNNNIFQIAWAVVEVENRDSLKWFLGLEEARMEEGAGITFTSDRQKGELKCALEEIKCLSTDVYHYVNGIPPIHWSRHAFSTTCKYSMILENLCEAFNAVLKAHPHLYGMAKKLVGIPCTHAMACIHNQRMKPIHFVEKAYTRETYLLAYTRVVNPMPGVSEWERTDHVQPLPPSMRKMPGRPSNKKRRKEADEGSKGKKAKRSVKCGNCGTLGHNIKSCKNAPSVTQSKNKGGRPPTNSALVKAVKKKSDAKKAKVTHDQTILSQTGSQPSLD